jgi:hypothetical protein
MSSAGLVTGTPTAAMASSIYVRSTGGASPAAVKLFTLTTVAGGVAPTAPTNPNVIAANASQASFTWNDNSSNETGFEVRRKATAGGTAIETAVKSPNTTSHLFTGLTPGAVYYFDVRATGSPNSTYTSEVALTMPAATTMYAQILVEATDRSGSSINGSTGWKVAVWTAPTGSNVVGTLLGQFTGQAFESALVSGEARMRVNLSTASALVTNGDSLRVTLTDGTRTTGIITATAST